MGLLDAGSSMDASRGEGPFGCVQNEEVWALLLINADRHESSTANVQAS